MQNVFKYCPNCRSNNTSFINNHRFECTDCGFVYYHNVATAVALIIKKNDTILFTRRNLEPMKGKLDLPGGFVDPNESAEIAAKRELKEELGITNLENIRYLTSEPNTYMFRGIQYRTCDIAFVAEITQDDFEICADEIQTIEWIPINQIIMEEVGFYSIRNILETYLKTFLAG